jgi:thioredoxin 1
MKRRIEVNERNFESEVLKSTLPVVVDFGAPWSGPGKMMAPCLKNLPPNKQARRRFDLLDLDDHVSFGGKA